MISLEVKLFCVNTRGHGVARGISQVYRQENIQIFSVEKESILGGWEALFIYTSFGCSGVGGSVDRIARLWVIVRWSWCACVHACLTDDQMNGL